MRPECVRVCGPLLCICSQEPGGGVIRSTIVEVVLDTRLLTMSFLLNLVLRALEDARLFMLQVVKRLHNLLYLVRILLI